MHTNDNHYHLQCMTCLFCRLYIDRLIVRALMAKPMRAFISLRLIMKMQKTLTVIPHGSLN